ncbi:MAG: citrate synthase [Planctomycetes bacterium]|nr:citrate synthase [Planctomycetota bacterium]MCB9904299.1 citrate synthase [Planctomycetota bacterium]
MTVQDKELVPGLAGIPAAESSISYIDGQAGILEYRGHRIETLAEKSNFEETSWLLLNGELPTKAQLNGFRKKLNGYRGIGDDVVEVISKLPKQGHPMAALQAGLAMLGMESPVIDVHDAAQREDACARLIAATPTLVAAFARARAGKPFVAPDPNLDTAANFLYMLNGQKPDALEAHVLDVCLVLHADHTMNASTFAARVVASTEADPYSVCASAVGALKGPLHGGANERVLEQLEAIGSAAAVPAWLEKMSASKGKIMGFGHRVYKTKDPRAKRLQTLVREVREKLGSTPVYDTALALEDAVVAKLGAKGIHPNVDFFSGIVYEKLGIPTDFFTPIFAIARVTGWLAHWCEQMDGNKIFRPGQIYTGVHDATYVPIDQRG